MQALLVEHPDYYTWGQLARLPLVLVGLLALGVFRQLAGDGVDELLPAIARNAGKDAGALSLDERLTQREADFVDGAGDLIWQEPGTRFSIAQLLARSLQDSDSTATDMLIRRIGEDALNRRLLRTVHRRAGSAIFPAADHPAAHCRCARA